MMDTTPLRSWLGLPPGPWPPDDATLLGLAPGADAVQAERRVLELMGRLRPHQLVHPELVTEGMNRLAQALIGLSAGVPNAPPPSVPAFDFQPAIGRSPQVLDAESVVVDAEPVVLDAEPVVLDAEPVVTPPPPAPAVEVSKPREIVWAPPPVATVTLPAVPAVEEPPIGLALSERRRAYRRLAGLRALARAWDALRFSFAVPSEGLVSADRVFLFLEGVVAMRAAAAHRGLPVKTLRTLAPLVDAVAHQPVPLAVFRDLDTGQRKQLARDWAIGRAKLQAEHEALRKGLLRTASARQVGTLFTRLQRTVTRAPEWVLLAATITVILVALVRTLARP